MLEAIKASDLYHLVACGFYRENHWEKYQWGFCQNTSCLWDFATLLEFKGFSSRCNGRQGEMINFHSGEKTLLAGMEDFHLLLRIQKKYGANWRWGMVRNEDPLAWDLSHKTPDEMELHLKKVARQGKVMQAWAREVFPDDDWRDMMNQFFSRRISL